MVTWTGATCRSGVDPDESTRLGERPSRWVSRPGRVYAFETSGREYGPLLDSLELSRVATDTAPRRRQPIPGRSSLLVANALYSRVTTLGDRFVYGGISEASRETVET